MKKSLPRVSVIIPTKNEKRRIENSLRSLLNQTYSNIEIIIVDSSVDGTVEIITRVLKESPFPYKILPQKSKGVGAAQALGLKEATGDIITFLHADQYFPPNFIKETVKPFCESDKIVAVYAEKKIVYPDSNFGKLLYAYLRAYYQDREYKDRLPRLFRKHFLQTIEGFDESITTSVDFDLQMRILRKQKYLKNQGFRIVSVNNVCYFEDWKDGFTPLGHFKHCIWYGSSIPSIFKKYPIRTLPFLIAVFYFSSLPFFWILWLITKSMVLSAFILTFFLVWPYCFYKCFKTKVSLLYALIFPFLLIFKALGHLCGLIGFFIEKSRFTLENG